MRKDYIAVDTDTRSDQLDEAAFVERYWTEQWRDRRSAPDVSRIARSDEYRVIQPYLQRLAPGSRILDGGCGMGEWVVFLAQQGFDVTGIDISADVVERLHTWFPTHRFVRGDLRHTDSPDASFDVYISWGTFEHFENGLGDCLNEAHRLVRPGGWLFMSVPFHNLRLQLRDARRLERWDESFEPSAGYQQGQRFYQWRLTREELRRELELRGFRVDSVTPIHKESGAGRWLQWQFRLFAKGSRPFVIARRAFGIVLPSFYISHMILAAAQRR